VRSWPLLVLAAPAAAEVWSGWVGIAQKTGFGLVRPLPGIWPALHLDTAITLPIGVEAYAASALRAWLARDQAISARTRQFAKVVSDLLLRPRHGRSGRLPPDGSVRDDTSTVGDHDHRVLPAGPGSGHGDRAGAHAASRRRDHGCNRQRNQATSHPAVPVLVPRGPGQTSPQATEDGPGPVPIRVQYGGRDAGLTAWR
jgi:hypothetical protein